MDAKQAFINSIIGQTPEKAVNAIVAHNPTGAYNYIQNVYGWPLPNWLDGFEKSPGNQDIMKDYLQIRLASFPNKSQFVLSMLQGISYVDPTK